VREAIEDLVVEQSCSYLTQAPAKLDTYVSIGCGLLAQDWIILEKLQRAAAELRPERVIFVELRAGCPIVACEGRAFDGEGPGLDLRQLGIPALLGPEFSFAAVLAFSGPSCWGGRVFEFSDEVGLDCIYVEAAPPEEEADDDAPGMLLFSVQRAGRPCVLEVPGCWLPREAHTYLFTVGATGMMRVYIDHQLVAEAKGNSLRPVERNCMYVGQSAEDLESRFVGSIRKIKIWNHCVDFDSVESLFSAEMEQALAQFAQWYAEDLTVWTFGSLASYAAAVAQDERFAADLLLRVDVHQLIDGYDAFVRSVLRPHGLALTLGGPGRSWCRRGGRVEQLHLCCEILEAAEAQHRSPWAKQGPVKGGRSYCSLAGGSTLQPLVAYLAGWPRSHCRRKRLLPDALPEALHGQRLHRQRRLIEMSVPRTGRRR